MRQTRTSLVWICALAVLLVPCCCASFWWLLPRNRLTIVNESGQPIHDLTVTAGDDSFRFDELAAGASVTDRFRFGGNETGFGVHGRLADGTVVDDYVGYVVWEEALLGVRVQVTIGPGGVVRCSH